MQYNCVQIFTVAPGHIDNLKALAGGAENLYFAFSVPYIGLSHHKCKQASSVMGSLVISMQQLSNRPTDWPGIITVMHAANKATPLGRAKGGNGLKTICNTHQGWSNVLVMK